MRLFLAISLPEDVKDELERSCAIIQRNCFKEDQHQLLRWTGREQLHITQYFLGNVDEAILPEVKEAIRTSIQTVPPFILSADKICWWPEESTHPKMIWVKFLEDKTFTQLAGSIYNSLSPLLPDLEKSRIPLFPHVTLIRLKKLKPQKQEVPWLKPFEIKVTQIELWRSFLEENGAKYKTIEIFPIEPE
jgi:2'-5' RNA ligase